MDVKTRTPAQPKFIQFRLRRFLIGCLVIGIVVGTSYSIANDIIRTCRTVPVVEELGAVVCSDFLDRYGFNPPGRGRPWGALVEWGMSATTEVYVLVGRPGRSKRLLTELAALPSVRCVILSTQDVSNEEMALLAKIRGLEEVRLAGTAIDDRGVAHLAKLPSIKRLDFSNTAISDRALTDLTGMRALEELRLDNTNVTSHGVAFIREACPHIRLHPAIIAVNQRNRFRNASADRLSFCVDE